MDLLNANLEDFNIKFEVGGPGSMHVVHMIIPGVGDKKLLTNNDGKVRFPSGYDKPDAQQNDSIAVILKRAFASTGITLAEIYEYLMFHATPQEQKLLDFVQFLTQELRGTTPPASPTASHPQETTAPNVTPNTNEAMQENQAESQMQQQETEFDLSIISVSDAVRHSGSKDGEYALRISVPYETRTRVIGEKKLFVKTEDTFQVSPAISKPDAEQNAQIDKVMKQAFAGTRLTLAQIYEFLVHAPRVKMQKIADFVAYITQELSNPSATSTPVESATQASTADFSSEVSTSNSTLDDSQNSDFTQDSDLAQEPNLNQDTAGDEDTVTEIASTQELPTPADADSPHANQKNINRVDAHAIDLNSIRVKAVATHRGKDRVYAIRPVLHTQDTYRVFGTRILYKTLDNGIETYPDIYKADAEQNTNPDIIFKRAFAGTGITLAQLYEFLAHSPKLKSQTLIELVAHVTQALGGSAPIISTTSETSEPTAKAVVTPSEQLDSQESAEPQVKQFNVVMLVAYNGLNYAGFQRQKDAKTVQGCLEKAISKIANEEILTNCAGRTDAGVHGTNQVINFITTAERSEQGWLRGTNTWLPADIRVVKVYFAPLEFHARHSAVARRYRYLFQVNPERIVAPHLAGMITNIPQELDLDLMNEAAQYLQGEQDFKSFQAANCQSPTSTRFIHHACFYQFGKICVFDIKANAFLYHMVRNIMGSLMQVGMKKMTVAQFRELIAAKDRKLAPAMAPADGLFLVEVSYPEPYKDLIVTEELGPLYLPNKEVPSLENPRVKTNPYTQSNNVDYDE